MSNFWRTLSGIKDRSGMYLIDNLKELYLFILGYFNSQNSLNQINEYNVLNLNEFDEFCKIKMNKIEFNGPFYILLENEKKSKQDGMILFFELLDLYFLEKNFNPYEKKRIFLFNHALEKPSTFFFYSNKYALIKAIENSIGSKLPQDLIDYFYEYNQKKLQAPKIMELDNDQAVRYKSYSLYSMPKDPNPDSFFDGKIIPPQFQWKLVPTEIINFFTLKDILINWNEESIDNCSVKKTHLLKIAENVYKNGGIYLGFGEFNYGAIYSICWDNSLGENYDESDFFEMFKLCDGFTEFINSIFIEPSHSLNILSNFDL